MLQRFVRLIIILHRYGEEQSAQEIAQKWLEFGNCSGNMEQFNIADWMRSNQYKF